MGRWYWMGRRRYDGTLYPCSSQSNATAIERVPVPFPTFWNERSSNSFYRLQLSLSFLIVDFRKNDGTQLLVRGIATLCCWCCCYYILCLYSFSFDLDLMRRRSVGVFWWIVIHSFRFFSSLSTFDV